MHVQCKCIRRDVHKSRSRYTHLERCDKASDERLLCAGAADIGVALIMHVQYIRISVDI